MSAADVLGNPSGPTPSTPSTPGDPSGKKECQWMYADAASAGMPGVLAANAPNPFNAFSKLNPFRWSGPISFEKAIVDLEQVQVTLDRPIMVTLDRGPMPATNLNNKKFDNAQEAINWLRKAEPQVRAREDARRNQYAITQGLLHGRVIWNGDSETMGTYAEGNFIKDFYFYLANTHVLLAVFMGHGMHPFKRHKRLIVLLTYMIMGLGFCLLLSDKNTGKKGSGWDMRGLGIVASMFSVAINVVLTQAATCRCVQRGSTLYGCCGEGLKNCCETCGACTYTGGFVFALLVLGAGASKYWASMALKMDTPLYNVIEAWGWSQVFSYTLGVFIALFLFLISWNGLRACLCCGPEVWPSQVGIIEAYPTLEAPPSAGKFMPPTPFDGPPSTFPYTAEYPNDREMLWGLDRSRCRGCCAPKQQVIDNNIDNVV